MASRYQRSDLPEDTGGPRTPVRKRIQKLEDQNKQQSSAKRKRGTGGQGRQPSPLKEGRQAKLSQYSGRKSPKAIKAREDNTRKETQVLHNLWEKISKGFQSKRKPTRDNKYTNSEG